MSAGVAVLTLVDQRRSRRPPSADRGGPVGPVPAKPSAPKAKAEPSQPTGRTVPETRKVAASGEPGRSGKASGALVLGLWGLVLILSNGTRDSVDHYADYVLGIVMSAAAIPVAIWAMYNISVKPSLRGRWLAVAGIAGGISGILVALLAG